jgi:hypothetical protein
VRNKTKLKHRRVVYVRPEPGRTHRSGWTFAQTRSITPSPVPWFSGSDWLALRDSIHEQCAGLFSDALTELARTNELEMLSLRYHTTEWTDSPAQLLARLGCHGHSPLDPAETLASILSLTPKQGWPIHIASLDLGSDSHNIFDGIKALEPLIQVPPATLAGIRQLSLPLTVTDNDLKDGSDEAFRYLLSAPTSLAELNITFCETERCFITSAYMAVVAECLSNARVISISIAHGNMSAVGLGNLIKSQGRTLQSLKLRHISFSDGDNSWAMLSQIRASTMLTSLELFDLTHGDSPIAMDCKAPGSSFSARGNAAVQDLWRHYMACYDPCWVQRCQQMACES